MIRSGVVEYKAPLVLRRDFTPNFPLRLMHTDPRLCAGRRKRSAW